ncbi:MAG TPA: hypothetical protein DIC52_15105 [Candidatus Latescibacteria bacterium]|nr:hypothetical protein [Candidatus Latescibacterota bacterium]
MTAFPFRRDFPSRVSVSCASADSTLSSAVSVLDLALEDARRLLQRFQLLGAGRRYRKQTRKHAETDENTDDENRQADTAVGGCW